MTDKERKAIEMALEALLDAQDAIANEFSIVDAYADAIEALRQALAQPEQEPVAWYYADSDVEIHSVALSEDLDDDQKANCIPLYTAPPSKPDDLLRQSEQEGWRWAKECEAEVKRLRTLLAKDEQEPAAWWCGGSVRTSKEYFERMGWSPPKPLYFAPPSKPWVSLTDEDIKEGAKYSWVDFQAFQSVAWWADELLNGKNT